MEFDDSENYMNEQKTIKKDRWDSGKPRCQQTT